MASFTESTTVDAPLDQVWETLADIGTISVWNPGVSASHVTTEDGSGLGAGRHCALPARRWIDEEVVEFEVGRLITFRITGSNLPFARADIRFVLKRTGERQTSVVVSPDYQMRYGPAGILMDRIAGRRAYAKGMRELLRGLKRHVEGRGESRQEPLATPLGRDRSTT